MERRKLVSMYNIKSEDDLDCGMNEKRDMKGWVQLIHLRRTMR
jgi:hypothetical protein